MEPLREFDGTKAESEYVAEIITASTPSRSREIRDGAAPA
jgi:hypothetical protein